MYAKVEIKGRIVSVDLIKDNQCKITKDKCQKFLTITLFYTELKLRIFLDFSSYANLLY